MKEYNISTEEEQKLLKELDKRQDADAVRMKRYLSMPDLARTEGSPIKVLVDKIKNEVEGLKGFDDIKIPEIVPAKENFDLFNFPKDHPARTKSDSYFVDDDNLLRTHTTTSWYYYLTSDFGKEKVKNNEAIGVICYGKVYRKDEIDRHHMNVFHQIDGWYITPKVLGKVDVEDLKKVLVEIVQAAFGKDIKYRFNPDSFPYTDPSLEMEVEVGGKWLEVLGCGVVHPEVLEKLGVDSKNYTGWAFGFGLERLAIIGMELPDIRLLWSEDERVKKQLKLGQKYKEVSKYPPVVRDISFIVDTSFVPNNYFDLIRETLGEEMIEEVKLLDKYENEEKFGKDKISYAYRVVYRKVDRTLMSAEVDGMHKKLEQKTAEVYGAKIR